MHRLAFRRHVLLTTLSRHQPAVRSVLGRYDNGILLRTTSAHLSKRNGAVAGSPSSFPLTFRRKTLDMTE
jgi:hypothetical protein